MVTQTPIAVKIAIQTLEALDSEVSAQARPRNRIINEALIIYLELVKLNRAIASNDSPDYIEECFVKLRDHYNTEFIYWHFDYVPGDFMQYVLSRRYDIEHNPHT